MLGALLGGLIGLVVGLPLMYFGEVAPSLAATTGAGSVAGVAVAVTFPSTLIYAMQAAAYFLLGFFGAVAGGTVEPPAFTPKWLWVAFLFGFAYFAALVVL